MDRSEAIRLLASEQRVVPEGQEFIVGYFEPADAPGVTRLFYAVYGDSYPIDTFYIPERLIEENRCANIRSVVARTAAGDVVSHIAFYRSSPSNPNLYEYGLGLTLPAYRPTMAFFRATRLIMDLVGRDGIDGYYGEAVCNHIITQKLSVQSGALETALEPALMPANAYESEQGADGRVGCMLYTRVEVDCRRTLHIPAAYRDELAFIMDGLNLDRELVYDGIPLAGSGGEIDVKRFDFAGVVRCTVTTPGEELAGRLIELEKELRSAGYALIQFFVDLGKPWSAGVVDKLREQGYSLGGLLPVWFGEDGLLMQKHFVDPGFDSLKIYSERGRNVADIVKRDWERSSREGKQSQKKD